MATLPPIEVFSDDPEIIALQALITAMRHFGAKPQLTMRHLKVLAAVELACKVTKKNATIGAISSFTRLKPEQFVSHLDELVDLRYLHRVIPTYGPPTPTFKLGAMGGTALRAMFRTVAANKNDDYEKRRIG